MTTRRDFLTKSALASAAFAAGAIPVLANDRAESKSEKMKNKAKSKIAVITWTYGIDDLDSLFSAIRQTGFEAVQFCGDHKKYPAAEVVSAARKYRIEILAYDVSNFKPTGNERMTLDNAVKHFTETIEYAKAIGAPMSTLQGLSYWTKDIKEYEDAMKFIIEATRRLDKVAGKLNMTLTYEACCHYELPWVQTADELLRIYHESKAENLLLVLDSFHMNIAESDMLEPIRKIGKLLHSYHISDSGRGGIGTGHIDYVAQHRVMKEVGFDGYVFFEIVIPECRPYKLPMNGRQMKEFIAQNQYSIKMWNAIQGA